MKYVDIHCHLDSEDYDLDREVVLERMKEAGVGVITIGADLESSKKAVEIAGRNENVWACIGVHPVRDKETEDISNGTSPLTSLNVREVETNSPGELFPEAEFEELVQNPKVVGIGECGLEYFVMKKEETEKFQKELFIKQIEFALKHDKPLMLHIRSSKNSHDAYFDAIEILQNYPKARGNVHFFAGNIAIAQRFLELGFTMSFTGVVTFLPRRSSAEVGTNDYDEVIKFLPKEAIMSETDAPWVAPVPYRGKRNEPTYVIEVVKKLAEIRGEDVATLNTQIIENFKRVFIK